MSDKVTKCCPVCTGRGYIRCACWPGDCICEYGDETCDECSGDGFIYPGDEQGFYWSDETTTPSPETPEVSP
jgi:hypothetical protein